MPDVVADYYPLITLIVGVATVIGMIMVLKINAFIALITAAIVVSLMAPGPIDDKIARVATAFGSAAGSIAIVIALAAVIGECMMGSGAADRIVQSFLKLLGEKRASWALMSSGFVLAVPVFFDTVFYLLVPLARSLYKKTRKNYLLYLLAIAAGGAITHTLVPPTPGPLIMASTLGIDLGKMIAIGTLVALPAAVVGLACSRVFDRLLNVPFRELETDELPDEVVAAHPDSEVKLPPLWLASLPVVLPVILISANTALSTLADAERPARLVPADVINWHAFAAAADNAGADSQPAAQRMLSLVDDEARTALTAEGEPSAAEQAHIVDQLNGLLAKKGGAGLYDHAAFEGVVKPAWKIDRQRKLSGADQLDETSLQQLDTRCELQCLSGQGFRLSETARTRTAEPTRPGGCFSWRNRAPPVGDPGAKSRRRGRLVRQCKPGAVAVGCGRDVSAGAAAGSFASATEPVGRRRPDGRRGHHSHHGRRRRVRGDAQDGRHRSVYRESFHRRIGERADLPVSRLRDCRRPEGRPGFEHGRDDHRLQHVGGNDRQRRTPWFRSGLHRHRDRGRLADGKLDERQRLLDLHEDGGTDRSRVAEILEHPAGHPEPDVPGDERPAGRCDAACRIGSLRGPRSVDKRRKD